MICCGVNAPIPKLTVLGELATVMAAHGLAFTPVGVVTVGARISRLPFVSAATIFDESGSVASNAGALNVLLPAGELSQVRNVLMSVPAATYANGPAFRNTT